MEKAFAALLVGVCVGAWTVAPLDLLGPVHRPGPGRSGIHGCASAGCSATPGSNLVGALAGISLLVTLGDTGRIVALAIVAALNLYGEFRSISLAIERIPLLRSLDSLGRVD